MRTFVGTMTGTSMDGIDAVATLIEGSGLSMQSTFLTMATVPLKELQQDLRELASDHRNEQLLERLGLRIGECTANAISALGLEHIDTIALHGQTIFHQPPTSVQLIDPAPILERFDCTVLTDPRAADLKLGGQGAPITPLADWILFRQAKASVAVVNLGGFCNVTMLPIDSQLDAVQGFDVCCCNLLLDAIARVRLGSAYDENGMVALQGCVQSELLQEITCQLQKQYEQHRSLGSGDDLGNKILSENSSVKTSDLLATAATAIGTVIGRVVKDVDQVFVAGGGVHNKLLAQSIHPHAVRTDDVGVPTQAREAMAMAVLGALAIDGVSITLPQITGRKQTPNIVGWIQASP
ncbi:MAG: anhydro-N-acetylmuramic acid kinase [Phycisphaerales bacterium]|jgi:1,6-anhydro-N-acetylmuramate kinase|nr:anhydro-N-acetylmuramic acid kinase [Phycisphaerales bacterium]